MPTPATFLEALDAYRDAVARRAYWEDHGRRRDGNLERAQADEAAARADLIAADLAGRLSAATAARLVSSAS